MQVEIEKNITPVFFDHDGAIDDIVSLILLLSYKHIHVSGISVSTDSGNIETSMNITLKILKYFGRGDILVAQNKFESNNTIHRHWDDTTSFIPSLKRLKYLVPNSSQVSEINGSDFLAKTILSTAEKTTILLTGSATNLVQAMEDYPELKDKIDKVIWMAGALLANGNVIAEDHDGSAEWNIYKDALSAQKLIKSELKIFLFPLDICQLIPVDNYLMFQLERKKHAKLCQLVYQILKPTYEQQKRFYIWDVVATSYLCCQSLFRFASISVDIETRGTSKGSIYRTSKGGPIKHAHWIDEELFYDLLIEQLSRF